MKKISTLVIFSLFCLLTNAQNAKDVRLNKVSWGSTGASGMNLQYYSIPPSQITNINFTGEIENIGTQNIGSNGVMLEINESLDGYNGTSNAVPINTGEIQTHQNETFDYMPSSNAGVRNFTFSAELNLDTDDNYTDNVINKSITIGSKYSRNDGVVDSAWYCDWNNTIYEVGVIYDIFQDINISELDIFISSVPYDDYYFGFYIWEYPSMNQIGWGEAIVNTADGGTLKRVQTYGNIALQANKSYVISIEAYDDGLGIGLKTGLSNNSGLSPTGGTTMYDQAALVNYIPMIDIVVCNDEVTVNETACNSYNFDGQTLTHSGSYTATFSNQEGCDSIVHLNLTITNDKNLLLETSSLTECETSLDGEVDVKLKRTNGLIISEWFYQDDQNWAVEVTNGSTVLRQNNDFNNVTGSYDAVNDIGTYSPVFYMFVGVDSPISTGWYSLADVDSWSWVEFGGPFQYGTFGTYVHARNGKSYSSGGYYETDMSPPNADTIMHKDYVYLIGYQKVNYTTNDSYIIVYDGFQPVANSSGYRNYNSNPGLNPGSWTITNSDSTTLGIDPFDTGISITWDANADFSTSSHLDSLQAGIYYYEIEIDANCGSLIDSVEVKSNELEVFSSASYSITCGDSVELFIDSVLYNGENQMHSYNLTFYNPYDNSTCPPEEVVVGSGIFVYYNEVEYIIKVNGIQEQTGTVGLNQYAAASSITRNIQLDLNADDYVEVYIKNYDYDSNWGTSGSTINCGVPLRVDITLKDYNNNVLINGDYYTTGSHLDTTLVMDYTLTYQEFGYSVVWRPSEYVSDSTASSTFGHPISTTNFEVEVSKGCLSSTANVLVDVNEDVDYGLAIATSQQLFTAPPFVVQFTNNTPSMANYNFTWDFGDGVIQNSNNVTVFHEYMFNGQFDVTLIAENITTGCTDTLFLGDHIYTAGGTSCNHTAQIQQAGPLSGCLSDGIYLTCNTDPSYTYQWKMNGVSINGATDTIYYPTVSGMYSVTIFVNSCPQSSSEVQVTINSSPNTPVITASGSISSCSGGSVTLSAPAGYSSYDWSSGGSSQTETITQSGSYTVTVTNSGGCEATSAPFDVNASFITAPDICIVGVDSAQGLNRIVWEKPLSIGIDSFYVYKETIVAGEYEKIGAVNYDDLAVYIDANSNPDQQANRYKLSVLDTCGTETPLSDFHKTMHLTINQGVGSDWNLIWSHYEGIQVPTYNIYRGTSPSNMTLLNSVAGNLNSYTDGSAPAGLLYYQVEVVNPSNCNPTKIDYGSSLSNVADNGEAETIINEFTGDIIKYYPNPTNGLLYVNFTNEIQGEISVFNTIGELILLKNIGNQFEVLDLSEKERGIYFVKIHSNNLEQTFKIILQ